MEVIRSLHNLRDRHRGCALSIGNFDGFHLGHQALVARLRQRAAEQRVPAMVQVFEPTPREFFAPEQAPGRIATFRGKLAALEAAGVERVLCVNFDRRFAAIEAREYVEAVLCGTLGVRAVVVGDDFRFGAGRGGDRALLAELAGRHGFTLDALGPVEVDGERVSSSALRAALAQPDLARAARLLGRPYAVCGRVRPGLRLGRELGMPTANLALRRRPALRFGVYAVRVRAGARRWDGVANLGVRPTLGNSRCLLESHLFGEAGTLYGETLHVEFVEFLRPEQRFGSLEELARQMRRDGEQARERLARR